MARVFISYSRVDTAFVERLYYRLQQMRPTFSIWYDQAPHGLLGGDIWWEKILDEIAAADIFIYVLSNESVQSKYCQAEFEEARRLQKRVITIQARDRTRLTAELRDIQYVDMKNGVDDPEALARLSGALEWQLSQVKKRRPLWQPRTPKPPDEVTPARPANVPDVDTPTLQLPLVEKRVPRQRKLTKLWAIILVAVITGIFALRAAYIRFLALNGNEDEKTPLPTQTESVAGVPTETTVVIDTLGPTPTATDMLIPTATQTPTLTPTPDPLQAANMPAVHNTDWTPVPQEFDGVEMVLVPAGCFEMGSTDEQIEAALQSCEEQWGTGQCDRAWLENERPVHTVCFEEPFWIDKYEVTNGQFAQFNGQARYASNWTDADRPRENITWVEARDFCAQRGARLPTEAEWEYAARGPEGWVYPWGNEFVAESVVYAENSDSQTADVGSRPDGVSWVGALDMSGNVWEWVADWYGTYTSGRQVNPQGPVSGDYHVLRGGSWDNHLSADFRASSRNRAFPANWYLNIGFRCVRSYE